jgi:hypothetical protein
MNYCNREYEILIKTRQAHGLRTTELSSHLFDRMWQNTQKETLVNVVDTDRNVNHCRNMISVAVPEHDQCGSAVFRLSFPYNY